MDPKVYKELLTNHRRGTNGGGEPHPRWCLDCIWWFWTLWRLDEYFVDAFRVSGVLGVFIEQRGGPGGTRGGHNLPGRAWASWRALVGCAPSGHPEVQLWPIGFLLVHKSPWSFVAFGLRLVLISCDVKNKQKIATSTVSMETTPMESL